MCTFLPPRSAAPPGGHPNGGPQGGSQYYKIIPFWPENGQIWARAPGGEISPPGAPRGPRGGGAPPRARPRPGPPRPGPPREGGLGQVQGGMDRGPFGGRFGTPKWTPKNPVFGAYRCADTVQNGGSWGTPKRGLFGGCFGNAERMYNRMFVQNCPKCAFLSKISCPMFVPNGRFIKYPTKCAKFRPKFVPGGSRGGGCPRGGPPYGRGGYPPEPPNGALVNGPYGPSSGSPSQYSPGGVPPWTPPR